MAPLPSLPSSPFLDYTLLRQFVKTDPSQFILGPSFVDDPIPEDFLFLTEGLPLMADAIYLGGPFTPTLLDVAAIIGLRPHDITLSIAYNPYGVNDFEAHLDLKVDLIYTKFIHRFADQSSALVTRKEHTTFLLYWLCHNLFCDQSRFRKNPLPIPLEDVSGENSDEDPENLSYPPTPAPAPASLAPCSDKRPIESDQSPQPPQQKRRKTIAIKIRPIPHFVPTEEFLMEIPSADTPNEGVNPVQSTLSTHSLPR
uniref:Aminotransferase-like plant mobile domain-containing protein n=1 Tax=Ananas comosus var. bracteatus TaxID=296719 RepID=A0A6V7P5B9_ANACO|nr:unnamed protein product [Ananas comosus var. bracteatus]